MSPRVVIGLVIAAVVAVVDPAAAEPSAPEVPYDYSLGSDLPPCIDRTDVVGYRQCTPYGLWGLDRREPYAFVNAGIYLRRVPALQGGRAAALATAISSSGGEMTDAVTFGERLGFGLPHRLYAAFDFELGNLLASGEPSTGPDIVIVGALAVGLRGGLGPTAVAVELAAGGMAHSYATDGSMRGAPLVEARGRIDLWLTPWFSFGGTGGTSLLDHHQWLAGFHIAFHSHAFAGDR